MPRRNAKGSQMVKLTDLSNDILLELCDVLKMLEDEYEDRQYPQRRKLTSLRSFSMVNWRIRSLVASLAYTRMDLTGPGEKLRSILPPRSPKNIFRYIRSLTFVIEPYPQARTHSKRSLPSKISKTMPDWDAAMFVDLLEHLPNLEGLEFFIPLNTVIVVAQRFRELSPKLDRIKRLQFGPDCEFLLDYCPNLEIISSFEYERTSERGQINPQYWVEPKKINIKVPTLKGYCLRASWTYDVLQEMLPILQNVTILGLMGHFVSNVMDMISLLASLENLRYLILPRADDCGLPHLQSNPEFRVLMRNSEKTVTPACHDIAKALFSAHPHLKCIWFDSIIFRTSFRRVDRAVAVRDSQGVAVGLNVYEESSLHTTWHRLIR